jgi:dipeptidyl aminopeptidase/acylaminoacyl peptidase
VARPTPHFALLLLALSFSILPSISRGGDAPPPASAFGRTPDFNFVAMAPDGKTIAMDRRTSSGIKVVLFRAGDANPLRALSVGDAPKLRGISWADSRTVLIDLSVTERIAGAPVESATNEIWRTVAANTDGGAARVLLMDDGARSYVTGAELLPVNPARANTVSMVSWDFTATKYKASIGSHLGKERRDAGWVSTLFDVDTTTGKGRVVERGTAYTAQWLADPMGAPLARSEWKPETRELTVLAKDGPGWRPIYQHKGNDSMALAGLTPDRKAIVAIGENDSDRSRAWSLPLDGSAETVLFEDPQADVTGATIDPATGVIVGYHTGGMNPDIHWIEKTRLAQQRALDKAFPGRQAYVTDRSMDGQQLLVIVESAESPPVYYLVDLATHRADIVGETYPGLVGAKLGEVRNITYAARDGGRIPAFLTLPPGRGEKNLPLVVLVHGGPESHDPGGFDWWAQFLATRGYAVLQPQFRGSTGYGSAHRLAGYHQWGGVMQDDVTDGVRRLVSDGVADPKRVCIVGASYGGYAALAGAALTPDLYACAVSVAGVSDLPQMIGDVENRGGDESNSLAYWKDHIGSAMDPKVIQASPARAADRIKAPILLMHGTDDTVVPPRQSDAMARALEAAGKPYEYVKLPGEDHWLSNGATRTEVLERIEAFLAKHL